MSRLKILLYADSYNGRIGTSEPYVEYLGQFGEIILISPQNDPATFVEFADVLAMPGGADVDPRRYNELPAWATGRINPHYEYLDTTLLPLWIKSGKPIIGICRGMQSLNVALGGNLIQDIRGHIGGDDRAELNDTIYTKIDGYQIYMVNSFHHQAAGKLGEGIKVMGWGEIFKWCPSLKHSEKLQQLPRFVRSKKNNGNFVWTKELWWAAPEIIMHETLPYIGFQYHPEEFNCELATKLISEMLSNHFGEKFKLLSREPFKIVANQNIYVS